MRRVATVGWLLVCALAGLPDQRAPAAEYVLDFGETGPVECGQEFTLAGLSCRTEQSAADLCKADDYHGALLVVDGMLVVDVSTIEGITAVSAVLASYDFDAPGGLSAYHAGTEQVTAVPESVRWIEELVLDCTELELDEIRVTGAVLVVHEIRIVAEQVPATRDRWSTVKRLYR
ncbi:MAG: hypothetical protein R6X25_03140 [Candidatus Krumholzibacteriia bacterium]